MSHNYCDPRDSHCRSDFIKNLPDHFQTESCDDNFFDSFASNVDKSKLVITRTFGLVPFIDPNITDTTPRDIYSLFTRFFTSLRDFKNICTRALLDHYRENPANIGDFDDKQISHEKKNIVQTLYRNSLHLDDTPTADSDQQREYHTLNATARKMVFKDAFFSVKNFIVRMENLINIINAFDPSFYEVFLSRDAFRYEDIRDILEHDNLQNDCFGASNNFSVEYLSNHILQIRSMFLKTDDFTYSQLSNPNTPIQSAVSNELSAFSPKLEDLDLDVNAVVKQYFSLVKRISTGLANRLYSYRKKLSKLKKNSQRSQKREKRLRASIPRIESFLARFLGVNILFNTVREFKQQRDKHLRKLRELVDNYVRSNISTAFASAYQDEFQSNKEFYVLRRVFRPYISRKIKSASLESFESYLNANIRYALLKAFRERLASSNFFRTSVSTALKTVSSSLRKNAISPTHKAFSIRLDEPQNLFRSVLFPLEKSKDNAGRTQYSKISFDDSYRNILLQKIESDRNSAFRVQCNFLDNKKGRPSRENPKPSVLIRDRPSSQFEYGRLYSLIERGFEPVAPTITFRNRKLKLHLPLTKKKEENIKTKKTDIKRVMSVDLGLLRLGTLSCWDIDWSDEKKDHEFARYFIKPRALFDQKIVPLENDKLGFEYNEIKTPSGATVSRFERPSNIWQRIINIRAEIRYLQRKKNLYEQRLKQKGVKKFRKKKKWNELRRKISVLWDRVSNINEQIVHNFASVIVKIAKHHQIDLILVENLKFSHHSKKREKGRFLAFWQTHWFFSQVQSALDDLCVQNGLPKTQKVYAAYSSQGSALNVTPKTKKENKK